MKWGLSVLDFGWHAIDERRDHPIGVLKAECGHSLMMVTVLHEEPGGSLCEACAAHQLNGAKAAEDNS